LIQPVNVSLSSGPWLRVGEALYENGLKFSTASILDATIIDALTCEGQTSQRNARDLLTYTCHIQDRSSRNSAMPQRRA
jgi:hypothetical protein